MNWLCGQDLYIIAAVFLIFCFQSYLCLDPSKQCLSFKALLGASLMVLLQLVFQFMALEL